LYSSANRLYSKTDEATSRFDPVKQRKKIMKTQPYDHLAVAFNLLEQAYYATPENTKPCLLIGAALVDLTSARNAKYK